MAAGILMAETLARTLQWTYRRAGARAFWGLALLLGTLLSLAAGIAAASEAGAVGSQTETAIVWPFLFLGALLAWLTAGLPLRDRQGLALLLLGGLGLVFLHIGRLGNVVSTFARGLAQVPWHAWLSGAWLLPDVGLGDRLAELSAAAQALILRLLLWSRTTLAGQPIYDPLVNALLWSSAFWGIATWAGWTLRRRGQPLPALFPAGAILALTAAYTDRAVVFLVLFLSLLWSGEVLLAHLRREQDWSLARIDTPELNIEISMTAIGVAIVLGAAALMTPSLSVQRLAEALRSWRAEVLGERAPLGEALGLRPRAARSSSFDTYRNAGLARSHLVGSGPELSQEVVLWVSLEGFSPTGGLPPDVQVERVSPPRLYWRTLTYDLYSGRGWYTGDTEEVAYPAGASQSEAHASFYPEGVRYRQQVRVFSSSSGLLHHTGELLSADHPYRVAWRGPGDVFGALIEADTYLVDSLLPSATGRQLHQAGIDYPAELLRYLALPPELPSRIRELALDLTITLPNPYDRALAIESYLRAIPYTLDLPPPPPGVDIVDHYLFDLQEGYCDYAASAMVVLARAAGLPARLVIGYASGTWDASQARFTVTAADAHAWPEIFFPGIGWVEFEPTGGLPAIARDLDTDPTGTFAALPELPPLGSGLRQLFDPQWTLPAVSLLIALAIATLSLAYAFPTWRLRRLAPERAVMEVYRWLHRYGDRLAVERPPGVTPHEYSSLLVERFGHQAPVAPEQVQFLTDLYARQVYSPHLARSTERDQAVQAWLRLRPALLRAWLRHTLSRGKM
jgi:transglutaminase-like putative cysteine protease